ncbi:hypothetical protein Tco_0754591 [Tanacetum coccineum]
MKTPLDSIFRALFNGMLSKRFGETFAKAWDRFKDLLNKCPHHGFSPLHQIDTFYNSLNQSEQDTLNSTAGGNFLTKNTQEALTIIENKSKVQTSRNKPQVASSSGSSAQDAHITSLTKQVEALISLHRPVNSVQNGVNSIQNGCETCGGPHAYYECQAAGGYTQEDVYATTGTYKAGGNTYQPQDQVLTESTTSFPPPVVQLSPASTSFELPPALISSPVILEPNPHQPKIPYPSRLNKEKLQDKFAKMVKDLLTNKEKLIEMANTPLNENCSAVLLKKLTEKLRDTGRFLIPCDFYGFKSCMALADLVDYDVDPRVPLILGRPILRTTHALVDVHGEELTLQVGDEKLVFNVEVPWDILESMSINPMSGNPTPSHDLMVASLSPSLTPFGGSDFILEEIATFLASDDLTSPDDDDGTFDIEGDIYLIETLLNNDISNDLPPPLLVSVINETEKIKSSIDDPLDLELKDLPPHLEYTFLEGTSKLPIIIAKDLKREEKE